MPPKVHAVEMQRMGLSFEWDEHTTSSAKSSKINAHGL